MTIINKINEIRKKRGGVAVALIDPDAKYENKLQKMIDIINKSDFDYIFIGGSIICDNEFDRRLAFIKKNTDLPLIIFPGSSNQISIHADGILFLSLISGRNPQYLIGEHIKSAPIIYNMSIEPIPIAYILLEGGIRSSVEIISDTKPIPMDKHEIILAHALAGQYLGKAFIFLETGSGAKQHVSCEIISYLKNYITIPIIVGGGIRTATDARSLVKAGADIIVLGSSIEYLPNSNELLKLTKSIHKDV